MLLYMNRDCPALTPGFFEGHMPNEPCPVAQLVHLVIKVVLTVHLDASQLRPHMIGRNFPGFLSSSLSL